MTRFFLGVDAGGSHCRSRLVDANGRVLAEAQAGPANAGLGLIALHATLRDYARFGQFVLDNGRVGSQELLPQGWREGYL